YTAIHTGSCTPVWCLQNGFLAFVETSFFAFWVHTCYKSDVNVPLSHTAPSIDQ
ncbi:hypothetical protein J1N35_037094, partial [Gossypium stocksii]